MHSSTAGCINGSSQSLRIYRDLNEMREYQCTRFIYIFSRDLRVSWQYSLPDKLAWKANDSESKPWNKLIGILVDMLIRICQLATHTPSIWTIIALPLLHKYVYWLTSIINIQFIFYVDQLRLYIAINVTCCFHSYRCNALYTSIIKQMSVTW